MYSSTYQTIVPTATRYTEIPAQYRFAWVAEDWVLGRVQSTMENSGQKGWPLLNKSSLAIEIAHFQALQRHEDTIGRWTQRICSEQQSMGISFNNLSGSPSQTVFARILDAAPLKKLVAQLQKLDLYLTGNGQGPLRTTNRFSMTIADGLPADGFENLLYRLGKLEFNDQVQINKLELQKKEKHNWKTIRQFYFS